MSHVDATNTATAAPAPQADRANSASSSSIDPATDFASLLDTSRQLTRQLVDSLQQRAAKVGSTTQRQIRVADALSPTNRRDGLRQTSGRQTSSGAERVDRLKDSQRRSITEDAEDTGDRPQESRIRQRQEQMQADEASRAHQHETASHVSERAAAEPPTPQRQSEPTNSGQPTTSPLSSFGQPVTSDNPNETTNANPAAHVSAPVVAATGGTATGTTPEATSHVQGGRINPPSQQVAPVGSAAGRETGSSGMFRDAAQLNVAKGGDAAANRSTGSTLEFQNILADSARGRTGLQKSLLHTIHTLDKTNASNRVNLDEPGSIKDIAQVVRSTVGAKHSTMVLRLDPPELGKLRVDVQMHDKVLTVQLQAETKVGQEALQHRLTELRSALEQQGIRLDRVEVEFRPPAMPIDDPRDGHYQPQNETQGDQSAAYEQQDRHDRSHQTFGSQADANTNKGDAITDISWAHQETDDVVHLAETGVDVVA